MQNTTGFSLTGFRVTQELGTVRGIVVRSRSVVGNIGASIQTLFGGDITLYTELCEQARRNHGMRYVALRPGDFTPWGDDWVNRYGARLDYEIWPEPNIIQNWTGTPSQMAQYVAVAATIIHKKAHAGSMTCIKWLPPRR